MSMAKIRRQRPLVMALVAALLVTGEASAQAQAPAPGVVVARADLAAYQGTYDYHRKTRIELVAHRGVLYAVLGGAKYPLSHRGGDVFVNGLGMEIPFRRDGDRVLGFTEDGTYYRRRSRDVSGETLDLLTPRPRRGVRWKDREGAYVYRAPDNLEDGIGMGDAGPRTVEAAVVERIVRGIEDETWPDVHSILISRRNRMVAEEYFYGYDRDRKHQMRSLTKGVIAMTVGAAIDRRMLPEAESALMAPYLRYRGRKGRDARREKITVADLLAMRSGVDCDDENPKAAINNQTFYQSEDWMRTFMQAPMAAEPGARGVYCSAGVLAAGRVVERASERRLRRFAAEALFRPLGVDDDDWSWPFNLTAAGADQFGQIWLRPREMMKLGLLMQRDGRWLLKPVLSESWVEAMTARQSTVDGDPYGYGVWHRYYDVQAQSGRYRVDTLMMSGNGGQKIWIVKDLELVVVTTGGSFNQDTAPANAILAQVLLPAIIDADPSVRESLSPSPTPPR